jgi:hypothetical protein
MSSNSPKATRLPGMTARRDPLDITPRPLTIPTINYRRGSASSVHGDVEARVRCEFVEMRGFSPTVQQAARLFQINPDECGRLLTRLVREGFLRQTPDGRYRLPSS